MWNWFVVPTSSQEPVPVAVGNPVLYVRTAAGNTEHAKLGEAFHWPETGTVLEFVLRYPNEDRIKEIINNTGIYSPRLRAMAERALPLYDGLLETLISRGWVKYVNG
jgi:hypothetical protein